MQVIAVGSTAQDLCTKLASVAVPGFFDSVEMADGSTTTVECKKNDVVVFKIEIYGTVMCTFPNGSSYAFYRYQSYTDYINTLVAMDKAIVLRNERGNGAFVMIAKDTNGDLALLANVDDCVRSFSSSKSSQSVAIFKENGGTATRSYYTNNDDTNKKAYFVPLFVNDDVFVDGVYVGLVRPYPNEPGYMPFTIGSTEYVGFGGTTFIVKT